MAQEEHAQKCSNSSSGGGASGSGGGGGGGGGSGSGVGGGGGSRSYKKMKQKKVPQRGLGVAQLEKIRLEEQQKKEALGVLSQNPVISPTNSSSGLGVQCPSSSILRPSISTSSSSVPLFRPPSPNDIPSPKSLFRTSPSIPIVDIMGPNSVPFSKPFNVSGGGGGGGMGWGAAAASGQGHGNLPRVVWNGEYNLEGENLRQVDHHRLSLPSDVNFGCQSTSAFLRPPNFAQGSQHFQPSIPSSSLMNVSTGMLKFQIEPPSNQNFSGSSYTPLWPDEEKMIGMKRPYPFSMETPPAPNFHLKYPPPYVVTPNPISRMNEAAASSSSSYSINRAAVSTDLDILREIPTKARFVSPGEEVKEKRGLDGDFLSLGPPQAVGSRHNSLRYNNNSNVSGHQQQGLFDFAPQPTRGGNEDNFAEARCGKSMRTSFFSFLPPSNTTKKQVDQNAADAANNCNGEVGENVDLSLKL